MELGRVRGPLTRATRPFSTYPSLWINTAKCNRPQDCFKLGLLDSQYIQEDDLHTSQQLSFQHLTFQDFLSALFLAQSFSTEQERRRSSRLPDFVQRRPFFKTALNGLCNDTQSYVVLHFLAGHLNKEQHPFFFHRLNQWLHNRNPNPISDQECFRVSLLCAHEAGGGDIDSFRDQLVLPKRDTLDHVTASNLTMLSSAVRKSRAYHLTVAALSFDETREEADSEKRSRVKRQTHSAMASLTTAVSSSRIRRSASGDQSTRCCSRSHQQISRTTID